MLFIRPLFESCIETRKIGEELPEKFDKSPNPLLRGDCIVNDNNLRFRFHGIVDRHVKDAIS